MHRRDYPEWKLRTRSLALGHATLVMGILNVTPDSFSDGGRLRSVSEAVDAALAMFADGAAIVDIGGESTRPGATGDLSTPQEIDRVLPVVEGILRAKPDALLSIDTYRAPTARAAVEAGVEIVNDVSGLLWDSAMAATCAALACGLVLMHTRGRPTEWTSLPALPADEVLPMVRRELQQQLACAVASSIDAARIILDPGFGFGKIGPANFTLLAGLGELAPLGRPLLAGLSRKGFLGADRPPVERLHATIAANTVAVLHGAALLRVHDVRAGVEAARLADAVLAAADS